MSWSQRRYAAVLLLIFISWMVRAQDDGGSEHVVLISVDGFRPEFYLDEEWPAPYLKQMAREGTMALGVRGVFPSVTYPSHTTLITGAKPKRHGIYYNTPFEPGGQTGRWYWENALIKTPTLWDAVRKAGKKSASFFWPVSVGAPIDYNLPEVWSLEKGYGFLRETEDHENPKGFFQELQVEVTGKLNRSTFNGDYLSREDRTGEMAAYTLETYRPHFMALHLIATDHFQHEEGRNGPMVYKAVAATDRAIGKIVEAAHRAGILEKTTFIITGDHGFVNTHTALKPNIWLVEAGLMEDQEDRGDWKAAFHTSGAAAFLILKNPDDRKTLEKVRNKLEHLPDKYKKLFRVITYDELNEVGASPEAALALSPVPGVSFSSATSGEVLRSQPGGTHGYFPDFKEIETGFVAWGAGIRPSTRIDKIGLEDIAPLIGTLLSLDFEALDGVFYPGILKEGK